MTSPFEDPEFVAKMAEMGIVHTPGMAARMMDDLAPLLAEDGIDLDNLDGDLDALNAALARATERHNLMLFTPVGAQRAGALAVLRAFTESLAEGDEAHAAAVLAAVESEPAGDAPAISHVIGVSLGLLDGWHTDPALRAALAATRVPKWNRAARGAATDVLALARKGRAFASLNRLHRHGGLALFEGSALVVAASLMACAASEKASVREVAGRMLVDGESGELPVPLVPRAASTHAPGSSFMRPQPERSATARRAGAPQRDGTPPSVDRALRRSFGAWLEEEPSIAAPSVAEELEVMQALVDLARRQGLDLHRGPDVGGLVDLLFDPQDSEPAEALESVLETLHDYVHFRLDEGQDLAGWEEAHEAIESALDEYSGPSEALAAVLARAEEVDPEARRGALARTPLIAAVSELLEWIGTGRPVTQTGGVRRADIETVARMLGVRAVGVAKRDGFETHENAPIQARSMSDVRLLAQWWEALSITEVIETNSSRVRPGPAAAEWKTEEVPPLELAEVVAAMFVAETLTRPLDQGAFGAIIAKESVAQLMHALAPEDFELNQTESGITGGGPVWTLRNLESAGLVTGASAGALEVPAGLRAAVARGILAVALLGGSRDE
ncbi:hypothetical protein [Sinomonas terrae]|uniref:Helicase XPB/Ssl2 N-terminal domain-containing protein n=1 Tax=Sinomonas terrae TaxID=2908838 RepID=A0ABS9TWY8_9MICC|nr:hypothetical protein [Sinomonas terrae]MCH6468900.1 hypothetical protein [Sinomonas terrae]